MSQPDTLFFRIPPYQTSSRPAFCADRLGSGLAETAILYRMNIQSRFFECVFARLGIPYRVVGTVRFYERQEIKDALAYLTLLADGPGQAFDPIDRPGSWHDKSAFKDIHTQAPSTSFGSGGGMDDRFDFQLVLSAAGSAQLFE